MKSSLSPLSSDSLSNTLTNKLTRLEELEGIVREYEDKGLSPKILDETIRAKEILLNRIKSSIERAEANVSRLQKDVQAMGLEKARLMSSLTHLRTQIEDANKDHKMGLDAIKNELRTVNVEIKSRESYKQEQEGLISESVERGNEELRAIKYELEEFQNVKQGIESEIYDAQKILESLTNQIAEESKELEEAKAQSLKIKEKWEDDIKSLTNQFQNIKTNQSVINQDIDNKLMKLKEKETSLLARESALRIQNEDLKIRERRLNSAEQLYS